MSKASSSGIIYQTATEGHPACKTSAEARSYWGIMTETGLPARHHNPESWMEWGEPVSIMDAQKGDTIILKSNGHHVVGLWESWQVDEVKVFCLEGKAGSSFYGRKSIRGIRRLRM